MIRALGFTAGYNTSSDFNAVAYWRGPLAQIDGLGYTDKNFIERFPKSVKMEPLPSSSRSNIGLLPVKMIRHLVRVMMFLVLVAASSYAAAGDGPTGVAGTRNDPRGSLGSGRDKHPDADQNVDRNQSGAVQSAKAGFDDASGMTNCPAGTVGSNCWNFECTVDGKPTHGAKTATCFCAINDGQFGREVRPCDALFTAAGGYFDNPSSA